MKVMTDAAPLPEAAPPRRARVQDSETDYARLLELEAEFVACLPVFPVLVRQLTDIVREVEHAVVQVCANFQSMAARSRQAASNSHDPARPDGSTNWEALCDHVRATLGNLLDRMDRGCEQSRATAGRIGEVHQGMGRIGKILKEVDRMSSRAKVLALNAKIEAMRLGEQGKAFGVVAAETSKLARHADQTSKSIRDIIDRVSADVRVAAADMVARADADQGQAGSSREEVGRLLDRLTATHDAMRDAAERAGQARDELTNDIGQAVVTLQFQDRVSQRLLHVVEALTEIEGVLGDRVAGRPPVIRRDGDLPPEEWAVRLSQKYTMDSERQAQTAALGQASASTQPALAGNNVELF